MGHLVQRAQDGGRPEAVAALRGGAAVRQRLSRTASRGQGADGQPLRYIGGNRVQRGHLGVAEDALEFRMDFDDEVAQLHDHGVGVGIVVAPLGGFLIDEAQQGFVALEVVLHGVREGRHVHFFFVEDQLF